MFKNFQRICVCNKIGNNPSAPTGEMDRLWHINSMEYYIAMKKKELLPLCAATCNNIKKMWKNESARKAKKLQKQKKNEERKYALPDLKTYHEEKKIFNGIMLKW